jgi:hypothetical protein
VLRPSSVATKGARRPESFLEFLAGDDLPFAFEEHDKDFQLLILHTNVNSLASEFARGDRPRSRQTVERAGRRVLNICHLDACGQSRCFRLSRMGSPGPGSVPLWPNWLKIDGHLLSPPFSL